MSEYEETDSLTLAVAKVLFREWGELASANDTSIPNVDWDDGADKPFWIAIAKEAIKAYELHQATDEPASQEYEYARRLAVALHQRHYPEVVDWKPLDDLIGILTQIDNMTSSLVKP
jgi:hypothetical protein